MELFAQGVDSLSGGAGWVGAGLLGLVLWWLMIIHLPSKDKQIDKLIVDKDLLIKELGKNHVEAIDRVVEGCQADQKVLRESSDKHHYEQMSMLQKILDSSRESVHATRNMHASFSARSKLADAFQSLELPSWIKNADGCILSWNLSAEKLLGWKQGEIVGKSVYTKLIPPDKQAQEKETLRRVMAGENVPEYESVRVTRDGQRKSFYVLTSAIRDVTGQVLGASTICREVE